MTYYLDVSSECSKKITSIEGTIKAICRKLIVKDQSSRTSLDLAEQNIKVLEHICARESSAIHEADGLQAVFTFIRENGHRVHKDTLHSAIVVVSRLCTKIEPNDPSIGDCVQSLSGLLKHEDQSVSDGALRCFASLADRFTRRNIDPAPLAEQDLIPQLLCRMNGVSTSQPSGSHASPVSPTSHLSVGQSSGQPGSPSAASSASHLSPNTTKNSSMATRLSYAVVGNEPKTAQSVSTVISLLSALCRGSPAITNTLLHLPLAEAIESALHGDERCILDTMRLVDLLILLIFEGRSALPKSACSSCSSASKLNSSFRRMSVGENTHRQLIECIRSKDTDALIESIVSGNIDCNFQGETISSNIKVSNILSNSY